MVKDLTPKKKSQKDLILAAIELLKAKAFDINPYTVADEAGIPRSSLYRSTEYMDLLKDARGEIKGLGDTSVESLHNHIHELEERNKQLEETLWNLEAEAEKLTEEKQVAWNEGFQAGRDDTVKRLAANRAADIADQPIPPPPPPQPVKTVNSTQDMPAQQTFQPDAPPVIEEFQPPPVPVAAIDAVDEPNGNMDTPFPETVNITDLGLAPDRVSALAMPQVTQPAASSTSSATDVRPLPVIAPPPGPEGVFNAARSGPYVASNFNPLVELSWKDVETVYNYAAANLKDITKQIAEPVTGEAGVPEVLLGGVPTPDWEDPSQNAHPAVPKPTGERRPSVEAMEAYKNYAYNSGLGDDEEVEGVFSDNLTNSSDSLFAVSDEALTQFEPAPQPSSNWQSSQSPPADPQAGAAARAYADQPRTTTEEEVRFVKPKQSYLDLGGDEEEPVQAAQSHADNSQHPYVEPYGAGEQSPYGQQNYANAAYDPNAFYDPYGAPAPGAEQSYQFGYPSDFSEQEARAKGRQTGDKLQALHDPRDFTSSEAVVDLDALDIFDDLDDYVDLDKIDIIPDVHLPPHGEEELKSAGDELRELIKGRIKQAADIPGDAAARQLGSATKENAAGAAAGDKGAAGMGARNKFIGGKAQQQTTMEPGSAGGGAAHQSFMPKIPPDIRKHALILGLSPEPEQLTKEKVLVAWKNQIQCVHPDLGGDTEAAVVLNTAKDALVRWLEAQAPKLGKKFGGKGGPGPT